MPNINKNFGKHKTSQRSSNSRSVGTGIVSETEAKSQNRLESITVYDIFKIEIKNDIKTKFTTPNRFIYFS